MRTVPFVTNFAYASQTEIIAASKRQGQEIPSKMKGTDDGLSISCSCADVVMIIE
jgi:hypothetical protein